MPNPFDVFDASLDRRVSQAWEHIARDDAVLNEFLGGKSPGGVSDRTGQIFSAVSPDALKQKRPPYAMLSVGISETDAEVGGIGSALNLLMSFHLESPHEALRYPENGPESLVAHVARIYWANPLLCSPLFLDAQGLPLAMVKRATGIRAVNLSEVYSRPTTYAIGLDLNWEPEKDAWEYPPTPEEI